MITRDTVTLALILALGLAITAQRPGFAQDIRAMEEVCAGQDASAEARVDACGWLIDTAAYTALEDYARAHLRRGAALVDTGRRADAFADFDTALEYDPYMYAAYMARGDALLAEGENFRAIADFSVAAGLEPLSAEPHARRGVALFANREYGEAVISLEAALSKNEAHVQARKALAWVLAAAPDPALRDGARALSLIQASAAEGAPDRMILAAALAETGAKAEALDLYATIGGQSPAATARFQRYLSATGYYDGPRDGAWSEALRQAIEDCLAAGCRVGAPRPRS